MIKLKTHSAFIFNFLDPNGTHGQEDIFLKSFMINALKLTELVINTNDVYVNRDE